MIEIKAPNTIPFSTSKKIFLAGSIEMDTAEDWQSKVSYSMRNRDVIILNPRRESWNKNWNQDINNPIFNEQVNWELNALEMADTIIMYFDPNTKSPISLLELGLYAQSNKLIVCCPQGYWRKGNVDIVCQRFGIKQVDTLDELIYLIK